MSLVVVACAVYVAVGGAVVLAKQTLDDECSLGNPSSPAEVQDAGLTRGPQITPAAPATSYTCTYFIADRDPIVIERTTRVWLGQLIWVLAVAIGTGLALWSLRRLSEPISRN